MSTPKLTTEPSLATTLRPMVEHRQTLIAERDALIAEIGVCSDEIGRALALADQKSLKVGEYLVSLVENQGRLTLDKHRLVELGVSLETIAAATVRGSPSVSLSVRRTSEE